MAAGLFKLYLVRLPSIPVAVAVILEIICRTISTKGEMSNDENRQPPVYSRRRFFGVAAMTVASAELAIMRFAKPAKPETSNTQAKGKLFSLDRATGWINSEPQSAMTLRGKVALVNFCTYTCINWLRSLPYVRAWATKYRGEGLVVVGVHTPEFSFEKDPGNVRRAISGMAIDYPVAMDNEYAIWNAFDNHYWPASYFIDREGNVRYHQFGEGQYELSERVIQQLLSESETASISRELVSVSSTGVEAAPDWVNLMSSENYLGYDRTKNFASPGPVALAKPLVYGFPPEWQLYTWALSGEWLLDRKAVVLKKAGGKIGCCFHARDLHLVMGPSTVRTPLRFRVQIDGLPPGDARGVDVDENGNGKVIEQRLYQLIRQRDEISDRLFTIEFLDSCVEAFAFTFG